MRAVITSFCLAAIAWTAQADEPKRSADQIKKEISELERKLAELRTQLAAIEPDPVPQNDLIPDLADNLANYKGKTITLLTRYKALDGKSARHWGNGRFNATDPKGKVRVLFVIDIPAGVAIPDAKDGEEVIVTFECAAGNPFDGNTMKSARRPK